MLPMFLRTAANAVLLAGLAFAVPACAQTPSEPQLVLARQIVVLSGMNRSFSPIVPQLMNQMWARLTATRPEIMADLKVVMEGLQGEFTKQESQIVESSARIFATRMSEAELKDVAAFFSTPSGKKYVEAQPVILDDVVAAIDAWRKNLSSSMLDRVRVEMKKKGHDI